MLTHPTSERLIALVDPDMKRRLLIAADMAEVSLGEYVRRAIDAFLPDAETLRYHRRMQSLQGERRSTLAAPTTFAQYLLARTDEDSPVGGLARDVAKDISDGDFEAEFTPRELRQRMEELQACDAAIEALDTAMSEYRYR